MTFEVVYIQRKTLPSSGEMISYRAAKQKKQLVQINKFILQYPAFFKVSNIKNVEELKTWMSCHNDVCVSSNLPLRFISFKAFHALLLLWIIRSSEAMILKEP